MWWNSPWQECCVVFWRFLVCFLSGKSQNTKRGTWSSAEQKWASLFSPFFWRKSCKKSIPQSCSGWCGAGGSQQAGEAPGIYCRAGTTQLKLVTAYDCQSVWKDATCTKSSIHLAVSLFCWVRLKTKHSLVKSTTVTDLPCPLHRTVVVKLTQRRWMRSCKNWVQQHWRLVEVTQPWCCSENHDWFQTSECQAWGCQLHLGSTREVGGRALLFLLWNKKPPVPLLVEQGRHHQTLGCQHCVVALQHWNS